MSTQFILIKPAKAERYDLWGRSGNRYFPQSCWSGQIKERGLSEYPVFTVKDAYPHKDDFVLAVAEDVVKYPPEWPNAPTQLEWATKLVEGILAWAGDDELWWIADSDMDDWPWDKENGYKLPDGRVLRLTGSGYTDAKLDRG